MYCFEFQGINSFLRKTCQLLLKDGKRRGTRGLVCYELPEPYLFKIIDPTARLITIPQRKWYAPLAYAESLWLASGRNDMNFINNYSKNLQTYSDDGKSMRGGYGPRFRHYNGMILDYDISNVYKESANEIDQFRYVVECFKKDINTRKAIINLGDPMKDCFGPNKILKETKDIPCTRLLHFIKEPDCNRLNLIVTMRSNDLIWGASAVNIFNFTFMQEYLAAILGMEIGYYFHIADNMHYYHDKKNLIEAIAENKKVEDIPFTYEKGFHSLDEFDDLVSILSKEEQKMRSNRNNYNYFHFEDPFFQDWYNVIYKKNTKYSVNYINPLLRAIY